jgi:hypothetical protein
VKHTAFTAKGKAIRRDEHRTGGERDPVTDVRDER